MFRRLPLAIFRGINTKVVSVQDMKAWAELVERHKFLMEGALPPEPSLELTREKSASGMEPRIYSPQLTVPAVGM
jgi:hypothetical protein